jgi:hypothetical protein
MIAQFKVKMNDGSEQDVNTGIADLIALEEKFGISASELAATTKMTWLAFLVWSALKRKNVITLEFEKWVKEVENLESTEGNA